MSKVAIVHDWLTGMRGGERCLEVFCEIFPRADLYTLIHVKGSLSQTIEGMNIRPSILQSFPLAKSKYRYYLPLMPWAVERFDMSGYDLILSSSHCVAKGVKLRPGARHICYCYSPMRYVWDQFDSYFGKDGMGVLTRVGMSFLRGYLREWDKKTAQGVDSFIAISDFVAQRIKKYYDREADVIYPPVDASFYLPDRQRGKEYFLMVSALVPYKRIDIAIRAFNRLNLPLMIIGTGPMEERLKKMAGPNIRFLGWQSDLEVRDAYAGAKALIFPGEEDFGITPLEAQSCGRPVIAYGKGGALETVIPANPKKGMKADGPPSGLFFYKQDTSSLEEALELFQKMESDFEPDKIRNGILKFDRSAFKKRWETYLGKLVLLTEYR